MASNNHASRDLAGLSLRLHELAIHTGDLKHSCLGCGHEHNCGIHGCALLREAAERIKRMDKQLREYGDCHTCVHDRPCGYDDIPCVACGHSENWEWGVSDG